MNVPLIENKLRLERKDLVKIHLFIKLISNKVIGHFSDREIDILSELYMFGGIEDKETSDNFLNHCYEIGLSKVGAANSIRNVLSKGRIYKVVKRKKANYWKIERDYIPEFESDKLVLKYLLTNIS